MVKKIRKKKQVKFYAKKGDFERTDYDDGSKTLSMPPEMEEAFQEQTQRFIDKFGRKPGPNDPIFFDPDADTPQPYPKEKINEIFADEMRKVGIDESYIRAYEKTGFILTEENIDLFTPEEIEEFQAAMDEKDLE